MKVHAKTGSPEPYDFWQEDFFFYGSEFSLESNSLKEFWWGPYADPEVGGGIGGSDSPTPTSEFRQRCGYRIREWNLFDFAQHLC